MTGTLIYDTTLDRLAIKDDDGKILYLYCGTCIAVERSIITETAKPIWLETRVEFSHDKDDWYLSGLYAPGEIPFGLTVKKT